MKFGLPGPMLAGAASYALVALALYPIPLFNILHAESMLVIAFASFFVSALTGYTRLKSGTVLLSTLMEQWALLIIPLGLLTFTLLWIPNCGYLQGLLFFFLFPFVTVVFGVSAAFLAGALRIRFARLALAVFGLGVVMFGTAYDLLLHPQLYTYNHVFGGFLGPIYDEELALRPGLFWFRGLTLLWAGLFVAAGMRLLNGSGGTRWTVRAGILLFAIGLVYAFSARLGINTPAWYIEQRLGTVEHTENFSIFYDVGALPRQEAEWIASTSEFRYAVLRSRLGIDVAAPIRVYLYPDPAVKASLAGARETSFVPVWLRDPQIHMLQQHFDRSFAHELVHVFSREFGLPIVNASLSVGLLEGLAVALDAPPDRPSSHALVSAAAAERDDADVYLEDTGEAVLRNLSATGFWGGRGAVSYTTMGSFVRYLLDEYGPDPLIDAYPTARFKAAYGVSLDSLVARWERFILAYPVTEEAAAVMAARFAVPSLFEVRCPHFIPRHIRLTRRAARRAEDQDTVRAFAAVERALRLDPSYPPANELWADLQLARGGALEVVGRFQTFSSSSEPRLTPRLRLIHADALAMARRRNEAVAELDTLRTLLPEWAADERILLRCRLNLVDRPDAISALYAPGGALRRATALANIPDRPSCLDLYTAARFADASEYAAAAVSMAGALDGEWPVEESAALQLRYAAYLLRAGDAEPAQAVLGGVVTDYAVRGPPHRKAVACDRLDQAAWMAGVSITPRLAACAGM